MSYRRLLRLLPTWYQERYADEMVEVHRATGARVGPGEVAATLRLAVTTRVRSVGAPSAATLWLVAVAAVTALALRAVWAVSVFASYRLWPRSSGWSLDASGRLYQQQPTVDLTDVLGGGGLYRVLWVGVLVLLLLGARRAGLAVASVVGVIEVIAGLGPLLDRDTLIFEAALARTDVRAVLLPLVALAAIALIPGVRGSTPGARTRCLAAGTTVATITTTWVARSEILGVGDGTAWSMLVFATLAASLVVVALARRLEPAWPAAVTTLAVVGLVAGPAPGAPVLQAFAEQPSITPTMLAAGASAVLGAIAWVASTGRRAPEHLSGEPSRRRVAAG